MDSGFAFRRPARKGHSWISWQEKKHIQAKCVKCGLIRKVYNNKLEYYINGVRCDNLPDCVTGAYMEH